MPEKPSVATRERVGATFEFPDRSDAALPAEYHGEIEERRHQPATLSLLAVSDVQAAHRTLQALQEACVRMTQPQDWVKFPGADGQTFGFLQDKGAARCRALWGISFDGIDARRDIEEQELADGHIAVTVLVSARCAITGEEAIEYGFRSTGGFFAKRWKDACDQGQAVEKARLRADVRKAAIANGRGRAIRTLTGLAGMPIERLAQLGLDPGKMAGAEFQRGGGGGNAMAGGASDAQTKLLQRMIREKADLPGEITTAEVQAWVNGANLTKAAASALIDRLGKVKPGAGQPADFAELGTPPWVEGAEG